MIFAAHLTRKKLGSCEVRQWMEQEKNAVLQKDRFKILRLVRGNAEGMPQNFPMEVFDPKKIGHTYFTKLLDADTDF